MPIVDIGKIEQTDPEASVDSVEISNPRQNGSEFAVDYTVTGEFFEFTEIEIQGEISDRDNVAGRGFNGPLVSSWK